MHTKCQSHLLWCKQARRSVYFVYTKSMEEERERDVSVTEGYDRQGGSRYTDHTKIIRIQKEVTAEHFFHEPNQRLVLCWTILLC